MIARFNPSGTHIQKGLLKVRIDLFPGEHDKLFVQHYVDEVEWDEKQELAIPTGKKQLNPCLCHFICVAETVNLDELQEYIARIFDKDTLATLDTVLLRQDSAHYVSPLMRSKARLHRETVQTKDFADLIVSVNKKLSGLVMLLDNNGNEIGVKPQSIDIGPGATDRGGTMGSANTEIQKDNPANASGTITSAEIWAVTDLSGVKVGMFYTTNGNTLKCRSAVTIGDVTSGSKQTFSGLSLSVKTGDYIGLWWDSGNLENDNTATDGLWYLSDDHVIVDDEDTYSFWAGYADSLYGTGEEAVGLENKSANMAAKMGAAGLL